MGSLLQSIAYVSVLLDGFRCEHSTNNPPISTQPAGNQQGNYKNFQYLSACYLVFVIFQSPKDMDDHTDGTTDRTDLGGAWGTKPIPCFIASRSSWPSLVRRPAVVPCLKNDLPSGPPRWPEQWFTLIYLFNLVQICGCFSQLGTQKWMVY